MHKLCHKILNIGIQMPSKNVNFPSSAPSPPAAPPPLCEKAVHRASHFPVGAKNMGLGKNGSLTCILFKLRPIL